MLLLFHIIAACVADTSFLETTCLGHEGFAKAVAQLGAQAWATQASGHLQAEDQTCIGNTKEESGVLELLARGWKLNTAEKSHPSSPK